MKLIEADALVDVMLNEESYIGNINGIPTRVYKEKVVMWNIVHAPKVDAVFTSLLQARFEEEEHKAFASPEKGLKEHVVWNRAIRILEEYMEETNE